MAAPQMDYRPFQCRFQGYNQVVNFTKMHGLGNDYVFISLWDVEVDDPPALARSISDRHRGIGSDGLILIGPSNTGDARMEVYNADGSRAQMCGNGIRCVAKYVFERGLSTDNPLRIATDAGIRLAWLELMDRRVGRVRIDLGCPGFAPDCLPSTIRGDRILNHPLVVGGQDYLLTCVSIGNPHAVIFVDDPNAIDLDVVGPAIEHAPEFPERINVHVARVVNPNRISMWTWERGSGLTQACGTGAGAAAVAGAVTGRTARWLTACLPGGELDVEWGDDDHVYLTGPAEEVFEGQWPMPVR